MPAYLIVNIVVNDPAGFEPYRAGVPALIRKHGGEYLVGGGNLEVVEGNWKPNRIVMLRFPDRAAANAFMNDPDYLPFKKIRHRVATTDMVLVDGM